MRCTQDIEERRELRPRGPGAARAAHEVLRAGRGVRPSVDLTQKFLAQLTPAERRNALIEAACLPMAAEANLQGLTVDEAHLATLDAHLTVTSKRRGRSY